VHDRPKIGACDRASPAGQRVDEDLQGICDTPMMFPDYPAPTQAVERAVHVVTEALAAVVGQKARHGYICARLAHRKTMPSFCSKKDFRL